MATKAKKTAGKQRNRVKVGKLSKPNTKLSKAEQKKVRGGLGDGSVHFSDGSVRIVDGTSNTSK